MSRGRRKGSPDTRAEVLAAARTAFAERGFSGTTIRGIAGAAGVDPSLVHHYFGSKDDLFLAALELPVDPREVLAPVVAGGSQGAGERFLRQFLGAWEDPEIQPRLVAVARSGLEPGGSELLRDGVLPVLIGPIGKALGLTDPDRRMALVASQIIGLIVLRFVLRVEPLASMDREAVVRAYAPTLQRYLTGDLDSGVSGEDISTHGE